MVREPLFTRIGCEIVSASDREGLEMPSVMPAPVTGRLHSLSIY